MANAILALLEIPGSTLPGINRMFSDARYRGQVVARLRDPIVRAFWEGEFARLPDALQREAAAPIQNKVGQFAANPLIRNLVGQSRSAVNLRRVMDEGKILIANLATHPAVTAAGCIDVGLLALWLFWFTPSWVRPAADSYAEQLLAACETLPTRKEPAKNTVQP